LKPDFGHVNLLQAWRISDDDAAIFAPRTVESDEELLLSPWLGQLLPVLASSVYFQISRMMKRLDVSSMVTVILRKDFEFSTQLSAFLLGEVCAATSK
jgi:hypothetical protein